MAMLVINVFVDLISCRAALNKSMFTSSEKFGSPNKRFANFSG